MSANRDLGRAMPGILAELGAGAPVDYADLVLQRTAGVRQRPAWVYPARWLAVVGIDGPMAPSLPLRQVALLLLLLTLGVAGLLVYAGSQHRLPAPFGVAVNGDISYGRGGDIYVADPTTGARSAIVTGPEYDFAPFYSRDGSRVAFLRRVDPAVDGAVHIVVAGTDGSGAHVITPTPLLEIPWVAKWAPDARSIAVVTNPRGDGILLFYDTSRSAPPRIVDPGMRVDGVAFQPPDGSRILFRGQPEFEIGLYTMNLDGSDLVTLVEPYHSDHSQDHNIRGFDPAGVADLRDPIWSPDGSRIVFRRRDYVDGADRLRLFIMNADGSGLQPIGYTPGDVSNAYPVWSPDGSRIAFLRYRDGAFGYAVVRLADGVVTPTGPEIAGGLAAAEWSPDGTELLVIERDGVQRVLILDPDGGPGRTLPWIVESPGWWTERTIPNATDAGSWQRLASP